MRDNPNLLLGWRETWTAEEEGGTNPIRPNDY